MTKTFVMDNDEYEVIPPVSITASQMVANAYIELGRPEDPFSKAGEKMMNIIIAVWEDLYPQQVREWSAMRKEHLANEMTIKEQVRGQTGRSIASIPTPVYRLMRKIFPEYKMNSKEDFEKLVSKYPIFRMVKKL